MKKGSSAEVAYRCICAGLSRMFRQLGRGAIRRWEEQTGRGESYLRQTRGRYALRLADVLDILAFCGIEPWLFFRKIFPRPDGRGDKVSGQLPYNEALACFAARARKAHRKSDYCHLALQLSTIDATGAPLSRSLTEGEQHRLKALDAQRYENPKPVLRKGERICRRALEAGHGEMALRAAGLLASALRMSMRLGDAETLLWAAYQQAERLELDAVVGDLLQRMVYVMSDRGDFKLGLSLAKDALVVHSKLRDPVRIAQAHVDCGVMDFHLGRFRTAVQAFETALHVLPSSERRNRYTAFVDSAFSYLALGKRDEATRCLCDAEACLPPGAHNRGRWLWLRAAFAAHGGEASAEGLYREALETFSKAYPGDAALASIELVHLFLSQGRYSEAQGLASRVCVLAMTLPEGTTVQQAAWKLARLERPTLKRVHCILEQTVGEHSCLIQLEKMVGRGVRPAQQRG